MKLHPVIESVTARIEARSRASRAAYLRRIDAAGSAERARTHLSCGNLAHAFAASPATHKKELASGTRPNVAIVSSYNDMLSAHQPLQDFPALLKEAAWDAGGVAQFAGGVPAMCDGVTQGRPGMQLSLFSRDVIAMATAIALSHDMFDAVLCLGVCDKIVPGLVIGALSFGHLPVLLVPAGPMPSGLPNKEKARVRQAYAAGEVGREELLRAESRSYHSPGTCTFYGTANSNQLLMEFMGLHLPGTSFINPGTELRTALTRAAAAHAVVMAGLGPAERRPIGHILDERAFVNGCVGLLASGGSTNHTLHLVAMAAAAGIVLEWSDLADLSAVVPLLARVYPNGSADINHFHAAGGIALLIRELLGAGLLHEDVNTVAGRGLSNYTREPYLADGILASREGAQRSLDEAVIAPFSAPFAPTGGLGQVSGNLGSAIVKTSALDPQHHAITAPARVFQSQEAVLAAFAAGELDRDVVVVVQFQGPAANGMPELHKLTPPLGVLLDRGFKVALVTDGRMSGASGKVPAAIQLGPECCVGGMLARVRDGDIIRLDADGGVLEVEVSAAELAARPPAVRADDESSGYGRELFNVFRAAVGDARQGASSLNPALSSAESGTEQTS